MGLATSGRKGAVAGQDSVLGGSSSHTTELATSGRKGAAPPSATPHMAAAHRRIPARVPVGSLSHASRPVHARVGSMFGFYPKTIRGGGGFILAGAKDEHVAFQPMMARRLRCTCLRISLATGDLHQSFR